MKDLLVKMALNNWDVQVARTEKLLDMLPDNVLIKEIAPGKTQAPMYWDILLR